MSDRIHVLVVEDDRTAQMVVEYALISDGFEVSMAEDGLAGLEMASEKLPDVILLDWMMPKMDGLELLSRLKADARTCSIPVFMLTSKSKEGDIMEAFDGGADAYITKPFNTAALGRTIRTKLAECAETEATKEAFISKNR